MSRRGRVCHRLRSRRTGLGRLTLPLLLGFTWVGVLSSLPAAATPISTGTSESQAAAGSGTDTDPQGRGAELFGLRCASCHGADAAGIEGRGPDIRDEGGAAADFVLRTGRMPLAEPDLPPARGPVRLSDTEIEELVAYVGNLGDGPAVPEVDVAGADLTNGGDVYRLNCAACHVASGAGAIIGGGRKAPQLAEATPTEVAEAIIVGPGAMPVFGELTEQEITDVAAYVAEMQRQGTTDVDSLGGIGPVAEGLVTWLLPLAVLVAISRWIGTPTETADPPQPDTGSNR